MTEIIHSTTEGIGEGERRTERDLGTILNELEHLAADVAEHTTTLEGFKEDRRWMTERLEALRRDLEALPRVPEELTRTFSEAIAELTTRIERLETSSSHEERTTKPPEHHHDESEDGTSEREDHSEESREDRRDHESRKGRSLLDRLF